MVPANGVRGLVRTYRVVHQSTEFTNKLFVRGSSAGPNHSVPPSVPGQMRIPSTVGALSAFTWVLISLLVRSSREVSS